MYDPGRDLAARYPGWVWRRRDLMGVPEVLCHRRQVVLTDRKSSRTATRCDLAHALAHLDLGHDSILDGVHEAREEAEADQLAARRLIDIDDLADALLEGRPDEDTAAALGVTTEFLQVRRDHLHPSERGYLTRRLSMKEASA